MSGTNDFLPFATGGGANVVSQAAYAALTTLLGSGYQSGLANSAQINKTFRQASIIAAAVAQMVADLTNQNVVDDGTTATIVANLKTALLAGSRPSFLNKLDNGNCLVAQVGTIGTTSPGFWGYGGCDRIAVFVNGTTAVGTINRYGGQNTSSGFAQGVNVTTTGAGVVAFQERVRGANVRDMNSKTVTVSCLAFQNTGVAVNAQLSLTRPASSLDTFSSQAAVGSLGPLVSIPSGVMTRLSYTLTLGSTDASLGLAANLTFPTVGAVTSKDFLIGEFQFEIGSTNTPIEPRPVGIEYRACLEYQWMVPVGELQTSGWAGATGAAIGGAAIFFPVIMRATPSVVGLGWTLVQSSIVGVAVLNPHCLIYGVTGTVASGSASAANSAQFLLDANL